MCVYCVLCTKRRTDRLEGHGEPEHLAVTHAHGAVGQLAGQQVGLREGLALRVQERQDGGQLVTWKREVMRGHSST